MRKIYYKMDGPSCLTECPHGKDGSNNLKRVNSISCQDCESFVEVNEKFSYVKCKKG